MRNNQENDGKLGTKCKKIRERVHKRKEREMRKQEMDSQFSFDAILRERMK